MKIIKNFLIRLFIIGFIFFLFWIAFLNEIYYSKTCQYSVYTIEVELLTGTHKIIEVKEPTNIHFQINCHSHKGNFNGCNLEAVIPHSELILGGHWYSIRDGVIDFKILNKRND
jgi:hypothetical protein